MDDVIYFQKCERTKKISIPRNVTECSKYIPVTFIANDGQNRSLNLGLGYVSIPNVNII